MRPDHLIAATRFGLGPGPGELDAARSDPRGYVIAQCARPQSAVIDNPPRVSLDESVDAFRSVRQRIGKAKKAMDANPTDALREAYANAAKARNTFARDLLLGELDARYAHSIETPDPFVERLVLFWSNHFAVHVNVNPRARFSVPLYERDAIRPHVLGRFRELLMAATTHPAMLNYLDNAVSVGPNSTRARNRPRRRLDINENHGRELLELHTLGVDGGYTQDDVVAASNILTGWIGPFRGKFNGIYNKTLHEPGPHTVMGVVYPDGGEDQLEWLIDDLSVHPSTARFLCGKLARHFVGDEASERLTRHLSDVFLRTGGDLAAVSVALVEHDEAWDPPARKMVPPYDFTVACGRVVGRNSLRGRQVRRVTHALAQPVWRTPSPAGWPDDDDAFSGGDAFMERVDAAKLIARRSGVRDVRALAERVFADALVPEVGQAVARAESSEQALVLLLMSPAFHRR